MFPQNCTTWRYKRSALRENKDQNASNDEKKMVSASFVFLSPSLKDHSKLGQTLIHYRPCLQLFAEISSPRRTCLFLLEIQSVASAITFTFSRKHVEQLIKKYVSQLFRNTLNKTWLSQESCLCTILRIIGTFKKITI